MKSQNSDENLKKISQLLTPEVFKSNLILTSVFIAYFENSVDYIIEQPRTFFSDIFDSEKGFVTSPQYYDEVLSLDKKNPINASLLWFKNLNCITNEDFEDFGILRRYRNKVTHELPKILMDVGLNIDEFAQNLSKLFSLRIKIEKWWFFNFEIDFMEIENVSELNENDVTTGGEMLYKLFMDLLSEDEEKANFYSKEIKKRIEQDLK